MNAEKCPYCDYVTSNLKASINHVIKKHPDKDV